jgi:hypothetical protein
VVPSTFAAPDVAGADADEEAWMKANDEGLVPIDTLDLVKSEIVR